MVEIKVFVRSHDGKFLDNRLSNDLTVKWIAVMQRQVEPTESMFGSVGEDSNGKVLNCLTCESR